MVNQSKTVLGIICSELFGFTFGWICQKPVAAFGVCSSNSGAGDSCTGAPVHPRLKDSSGILGHLGSLTSDPPSQG